MVAKNISTVVKDGKAVFVVDLSGDLGPSKSGKSNLIASGGGSIADSDGISFSLNVFRKVKGGAHA